MICWMVLGGFFTKNAPKMVRGIDGDPLFSASKIDILSVGILFGGPLLVLAQFLCISLLFGHNFLVFPTTLGSISDYFPHFRHMLCSKIAFFNIWPPFVHHFNIFLQILCNFSTEHNCSTPVSAEHLQNNVDTSDEGPSPLQSDLFHLPWNGTLP